MNLFNLFEDNNQPGSNYAEQLAYQIFKVEPNLDATGTADEVLDYAFDLAVHDLGRKRAHSLFAYDEDFDGDLVSAYAHLQHQGTDKEQVNEVDPRNFDSDEDYYAALKAQPKQRSSGAAAPTRVHPEDTDFMDPVERRLRADQARVKAAWAAHNAKKGVEESKMSEIDAEYQDYKKLSPREFYNMYKMTKQQWFEKHKGLLQGVAEANKKKDDELGSEIRDVALQRAITKAKSDFPTAGSGIEALAKDFMRSQDQDQKSFDQIRRAERQQDQMLAQINKIDQEQEQELQGLEKQNSGLANRLQQLQSVNSQLEKKLAAMSGRSTSKKIITPAVPSTEPASNDNIDAITPAKVPKAKTKTKPAPSAMKSTAAQLAAPKVDPMAAMSQRITKGDTSVLDKVTGQSALPFEPSDNVLEPIITQRQQNPRFAAAKRDAEDARYSQMVKDLARDPQGLKTAMGLGEEEEEADYSDKYQDMVARVGQKAREQEKKKPVDIADLARRLAAIEASHKDK